MAIHSPFLPEYFSYAESRVFTKSESAGTWCGGFISSVLKEIPSASIFSRITSMVFSFVAQIGQRLSNSPSKLFSEISNMLNASVSSPDSSSLILIPSASPYQSPCGIRRFNARTAFVCPHSANGRRSIRDKSPVRAFFPFHGAIAWPFSPAAAIFRQPSSEDTVNRIPSSSSMLFARAPVSSPSRPSNNASAAPGTTFVFVPLWKDTIFGRRSDGSNSAVKLPPIRPFSILITGKDASGEKVIGASFSTL